MHPNLVAYHEPRQPFAGHPWWEMTFYRADGYAPAAYEGYRDVTADSIPIYFGEEERHRYLPESGCNQYQYSENPPVCTNNYTVEQFLISAVGAKRGGAAGYTWHTNKLYRYWNNYFPNPGLTEVEWNVVNQIGPRLGATTWPRNP